MGGIIEDKIFEVLLGEKMNCKEIKMSLENISCVREYSTVDKYLRKMYNLKILERSNVIENERI